MVRYLISTTEELHGALKIAAQSRGQTLTSLIRQILWEWVKNQKQSDQNKEKEAKLTETSQPRNTVPIDIIHQAFREAIDGIVAKTKQK